MWEHEKLGAYSKALDAAVAVERFARTLPVIHRDLARQLRRAVSSVVLNLAEGAGEFSASEKARFYRISRRSCSESVAAVDLLERLVRPTMESRQAKALLAEVAAMLTGLIKSRTNAP